MATTVTLVGQQDFGGGMRCLAPADNQYEFGQNLIIRDRQPQTRWGIRRRWRANTQGFGATFYFNEEQAEVNDDNHTGFWFECEFLISLWDGVQGVGQFRFPSQAEEGVIFVASGKIYRHAAGYAEEIACAVAIGTEEAFSFCQATNYLFAFRGEDLQPLCWDGTATGFVLVPDSVAMDDMPWAGRALYSGVSARGTSGNVGGRMWLCSGRDNVCASDVLAPFDWDLTYQNFGIRAGDGDELTCLWPFQGDYLLAFKKRSVSLISGIKQPVGLETVAGSGVYTKLSDVIAVSVLDPNTGLVAPRAVATVGEDVWYLGYGGIYTVQRNQANNVQRMPVALSAPVQSIVDQINWAAIACAAAAVHDNYVLFAVPLDGSTVNNAILVYDLLAPAAEGSGAWLGVWTSRARILSVLDFLKVGPDLLYLDADGVLRQMFVDSATDSDDPIEDTPLYDAAQYYEAGAWCRFEVDGVWWLYEAAVPTIGNDPTDADYWTELEWDDAYAIETVVRTRQYTLDGRQPALKSGRGELLFQHQRPELTVDMISANNSRTRLFTDVTYPQTSYDIADVEAWDPSTDADGCVSPYRKDFAVMIPEAGLLFPAAGVVMGRYRRHSLRWIQMLLSDRSFGYEIRSSRGRLRVESVYVPVTERKWAAKNEV